MTNRDWSFSIESLRQRLGVDRLLALNDFTALALALPTLAREELESVGVGKAVAGEARALIGPGTGLGVGCLLAAGGGVLPLRSEGGHVTLSAVDEREERVIAALRREFGHPSAERALSGSGLVNLYRFACAEANRAPLPLLPADVSARALARSDEACTEAVELFFALLGGVAGNLALTVGARGGVYIGGGIVPRLGDWLDPSLAVSGPIRFERPAPGVSDIDPRLAHPAQLATGAPWRQRRPRSRAPAVALIRTLDGALRH